MAKFCFKRTTPGGPHLGEVTANGTVYFLAMTCNGSGAQGYVLSIVAADGRDTYEVQASGAASSGSLESGLRSAAMGLGPIGLAAASAAGQDVVDALPWETIMGGYAAPNTPAPNV
ncbi:MAG: hypothetical protein K2X38_21895 [Gemmataceae bacterium]|nr:hypothetical protein [Gemmataceae bacterium]